MKKLRTVITLPIVVDIDLSDVLDTEDTTWTTEIAHKIAKEDAVLSVLYGKLNAAPYYNHVELPKGFPPLDGASRRGMVEVTIVDFGDASYDSNPEWIDEPEDAY